MRESESVCVCVCERERERERERETETETETERQRERHTQRETETDRERERSIPCFASWTVYHECLQTLLSCMQKSCPAVDKGVIIVIYAAMDKGSHSLPNSC